MSSSEQLFDFEKNPDKFSKSVQLQMDDMDLLPAMSILENNVFRAFEEIIKKAMDENSITVPPELRASLLKGPLKQAQLIADKRDITEPLLDLSRESLGRVTQSYKIMIALMRKCMQFELDYLKKAQAFSDRDTETLIQKYNEPLLRILEYIKALDRVRAILPEKSRERAYIDENITSLTKICTELRRNLIEMYKYVPPEHGESVKNAQEQYELTTFKEQLEAFYIDKPGKDSRLTTLDKKITNVLFELGELRKQRNALTNDSDKRMMDSYDIESKLRELRALKIELNQLQLVANRMVIYYSDNTALPKNIASKMNTQLEEFQKAFAAKRETAEARLSLVDVPPDLLRMDTDQKAKLDKQLDVLSEKVAKIAEIEKNRQKVREESAQKQFELAQKEKLKAKENIAFSGLELARSVCHQERKELENRLDARIQELREKGKNRDSDSTYKNLVKEIDKYKMIESAIVRCQDSVNAIKTVNYIDRLKEEASQLNKLIKSGELKSAPDTTKSAVRETVKSLEKHTKDAEAREKQRLFSRKKEPKDKDANARATLGVSVNKPRSGGGGDRG